MLEAIKQLFLTPPVSVEAWGVECEAMVTILYLALVRPLCIPHVLLRGIMVDFIRRCKYELKHLYYLNFTSLRNTSFANFDTLFRILYLKCVRNFTSVFQGARRQKGMT